MSEQEMRGRQGLPVESQTQETGRRRVRMAREQRAKQFMPFMPLAGYQQALRERELKVELESELERVSEEM